MQATLTPKTQHIGPYELGPLVHRGEHSAVYEAVDSRTQDTVAVKLLFLDPNQSETEHAAQDLRFERDTRALIALTRPPRIHPHLVHIRDMGLRASTLDGPAHYLVMERLEGETLRERLHRRGALMPSETADYLLQIADALTALQEEGVVHCAVRPENIFFAGVGGQTAKLMDFGLHCPADSGEASQTPEVARYAPYLSPEQAAGKPATAASDVWALGVVLYEMLAGHAPYAGATTADTLYNVAYGEAMPIAGLHAAANHVVLCALERAPEARYPNPMALARDFRAALATQTVTAIPVASEFATLPAPIPPIVPPKQPRRARQYNTAPPVPAPYREKNKTWQSVAATAAVVGIAAMAVGWYSLRSPGPEAHQTSSAAITAPPTKLATSLPQTVAKIPTRSPARPTPAAKASVLPVPAPWPAGSPAPIPSALPLVAPRTEPIITEAIPTGTAIPANMPAPTAHQVDLPRTIPVDIPSPIALPESHGSVATLPPTPRVTAPQSALPADVPEKPQERLVATPESAAPRVHEGEPLSFKGAWQGTYAGNPAKLTVEKQNDEQGTFSGILLVTTDNGAVVLAVTGRLNDDNGVAGLELKEEKVLRQANGLPWQLGKSMGVLTASGGMKSGGSDRNWSFQR